MITALSSTDIRIDGLKKLNAGKRVEFRVTGIRLPRYQGQVIEPIQIATLESGIGGKVDIYKHSFFVQSAM